MALGEAGSSIREDQVMKGGVLCIPEFGMLDGE